MTQTIKVKANPDADDCLAYAAEEYIEDHPELQGWDLSPEWGDDDRETVALSVPEWYGERLDALAQPD